MTKKTTFKKNAFVMDEFTTMKEMLAVEFLAVKRSTINANERGMDKLAETYAKLAKQLAKLNTLLNKTDNVDDVYAKFARLTNRVDRDNGKEIGFGDIRADRLMPAAMLCDTAFKLNGLGFKNTVYEGIKKSFDRFAGNGDKMLARLHYATSGYMAMDDYVGKNFSVLEKEQRDEFVDSMVPLMTVCAQYEMQQVQTRGREAKESWTK